MTNAELITALRFCADDGIPTELKCSIKCPYRDGEYKCLDNAMNDAADALEAADKRIAELEAKIPKDGEWIDDQRGRWIYAKCNLCGKVQDVRSNYCPNCGAKMKGEQE